MTRMKMIARKFSGHLHDAAMRRRTQISLEGLSDDVLRDIGVEPGAVRRFRGPPAFHL